MTRTIVAFVLVAVLMLALAAPALAVTGAGGAGQVFGQMHAEHARDGVLGQEMNPGNHQGFSGWHHMP